MCTRKDCFRAPAHFDCLNLDIPKAMVSKIRCMYRCPYHRGKDEQVLFLYVYTYVRLILLGKVSIQNKIKSYRIFHPNFTPPPPPFDGKKTFFFHNILLCLYYVYYHQIWRELWRKNCYLLFLKCLEPKSWSQKIRQTAVIPWPSQ